MERRLASRGRRQGRSNWAKLLLREGTVMSASSGIPRLSPASMVRVAVLCVLFGVWGFVPLVGADIPRTVYGPGGLATGGTTTALGTAHDITVGKAAGNVFVMDVIPDVDSVKMAASDQQTAPTSDQQTAAPSPSAPTKKCGCPESPPPPNCKPVPSPKC